MTFCPMVSTPTTVAVNSLLTLNQEGKNLERFQILLLLLLREDEILCSTPFNWYIKRRGKLDQSTTTSTSLLAKGFEKKSSVSDSENDSFDGE